MLYGSVCSGIEAVTVAWEPLGFKPAWFAEINPFCSELLKHHYPGVKNHGDFTKISESAGSVDIIIGGTPCQSFSIAGNREGLDDSRGNLAIEFYRLVERMSPRWFVWENVPGVLSTNKGKDFSRIIKNLANIGYGCCWRVLDAQHFGIPQQRRRVFLVGYLGDWRPAAATLFEQNSLRGYHKPYEKVEQDDSRKHIRCIKVNRTGIKFTETSPTLDTHCKHSASCNQGGMIVLDEQQKRVRWLTAVEFERIQGFPDNYTNIQYRNKQASDHMRCRAIGNSMAIPVMRWIGERIRIIENIISCEQLL